MNEKVLSLAKGAIDFGVDFTTVSAPFVLGNPLGILAAISITIAYCTYDYFYGVKNTLRTLTYSKNARREENFQNE